MREATARDTDRGLRTGSSEYVKFIILGGARTGSTLLANALNSSPRVVCFREVFNFMVDFVDYRVDGYDNNGAADRALRDSDWRAFLRDRIFCEHPGAGAVGFKMPYDHVMGFPGLLDWLVLSRDIRVVHIQRRNLLRTLVSLRVAEQTGVWADVPEHTMSKALTRDNALKATRSPTRAATAMWKLIAPHKRLARRGRSPDVRVRLSPDECREFFDHMRLTTHHFDNLFRDHPKLPVLYQELVDRRDQALAMVQSFLGVSPAPLRVDLRRQNPEPLPELVENYDELRRAFRGSPYEWMFDHD